MKKILTTLTLVMFSTTAFAVQVDVEKLSNLTRADEVAITRGWSGDISACFEMKYSDLKVGLNKKEKQTWVVEQNYDKQYVQLRDTIDNYIWRCAKDGIYFFDDEEGWGHASYEEYGF